MSIITTAPLRPYTIQYGNSPVIFLGPHNGKYIPSDLVPTLDLSIAWQNSVPNELLKTPRHEQYDIGMHELFETMMEKTNSYAKPNYLWGNYSRLVADLNRLTTQDHCFSIHSSDTNCPILGNIGLTDEHRTERYETVYRPYYQALMHIIKETKSTFGDAIILDMHSFTPKYQGKERSTHIGTLYAVDHAKHQFTSQFLQKQCAAINYRFEPCYPYSMTDDATPGKEFAARNGIDYLGIEIRNDCLADPENIQTLADLMLELGEQLAQTFIPQPISAPLADCSL